MRMRRSQTVGPTHRGRACRAAGHRIVRAAMEAVEAHRVRVEDLRAAAHHIPAEAHRAAVVAPMEVVEEVVEAPMAAAAEAAATSEVGDLPNVTRLRLHDAPRPRGASRIWELLIQPTTEFALVRREDESNPSATNRE